MTMDQLKFPQRVILWFAESIYDIFTPKWPQLIPEYDLAVIFAVVSKSSFLVTAFCCSLILGDVRSITFGRVWVGFTFLFFSPVIYFTVRLFIDLVADLFEA